MISDCESTHTETTCSENEHSEKSTLKDCCFIVPPFFFPLSDSVKLIDSQDSIHGVYRKCID